MTLGSMIEADKRLRLHETIVRRQKKMARDEEVWKRYESRFEDRSALLASSGTGTGTGTGKGSQRTTAAAVVETKGTTAGGEKEIDTEE